MISIPTQVSGEQIGAALADDTYEAIAALGALADALSESDFREMQEEFSSYAWDDRARRQRLRTFMLMAAEHLKNADEEE